MNIHLLLNVFICSSSSRRLVVVVVVEVVVVLLEKICIRRKVQYCDSALINYKHL